MENIVTKIKALLNKSKSTDSQQEAEALMLKAQELLQKHNIEMAEIEERMMEDEKKNRRGAELFEHDSDVDFEKNNWQAILLSALAKENMCELMVINMPLNFHEINTKDMLDYMFGIKKVVRVIGMKENVEVVMEMFYFYRNVIIEYTDKKLNEKVNEIKGINRFQEIQEFKQSYITGLIAGINFKMHVNNMRNDESMRCLVLANKSKIEDHMENKYPNSGVHSVKHEKNDEEAFKNGLIDGLGIEKDKNINN